MITILAIEIAMTRCRANRNCNYQMPNQLKLQLVDAKPIETAAKQLIAMKYWCALIAMNCNAIYFPHSMAVGYGCS